MKIITSIRHVTLYALLTVWLSSFAFFIFLRMEFIFLESLPELVLFALGFGSMLSLLIWCASSVYALPRLTRITLWILVIVFVSWVILLTRPVVIT